MVYQVYPNLLQFVQGQTRNRATFFSEPKQIVSVSTSRVNFEAPCIQVHDSHLGSDTP